MRGNRFDFKHKCGFALTLVGLMSMNLYGCTDASKTSFVRKSRAERFDRLGNSLQSRIIFMIDSSVSMGTVYSQVQQSFPSFSQKYLEVATALPNELLHDTCISWFPTDGFMNNPIYGKDQVSDEDLNLVDPLCTIDPKTGRRIEDNQIRMQFDQKMNQAIEKLKGSFVSRFFQSMLWMINKMTRTGDTRFLGKKSPRYYMVFADSEDRSSAKPEIVDGSYTHGYHDVWPISSYMVLFPVYRMESTTFTNLSALPVDPNSGNRYYTLFEIIGFSENESPSNSANSSNPPANVYQKGSVEDYLLAFDAAHREHDEISGSEDSDYAIHLIGPTEDDTVVQLRKTASCTQSWSWNGRNTGALNTTNPGVGMPDPSEIDQFTSKPAKIMLAVDQLKSNPVYSEKNKLAKKSKYDNFCGLDMGDALDDLGESLSSLNDFVELEREPDINEPIKITFYDRQNALIATFNFGTAGEYGEIDSQNPKIIRFHSTTIQNFSPSSAMVEYFPLLKGEE